MSHGHYLPMDKLWALVDRLTDQNAALVDEVERAIADATIAQKAAARLVVALRERGATPEQIQKIIDFPDTPGNQENTGE